MEPKTSHSPRWSLRSSCDHSSFQTRSLVHPPPFWIFSDATRPSFSTTRSASEPLSFPFIYIRASQTGRVLHLGDTWNYLKTFLRVTAGPELGKHPTTQRISLPLQSITRSQASVLPMLRNSALGYMSDHANHQSACLGNLLPRNVENMVTKHSLQLANCPSARL